MKINIVGVNAPTEKQRSVGIHGSVNLELAGTDGSVIARLNGITVRQSKSGNKFMSPPAFKITGKDGADKWLQHFNLFPLSGDEGTNAVQKENLNKLTQEVLRMLDGNNNGQQQASSPAPVAQNTASSDAEPWS